MPDYAKTIIYKLINYDYPELVYVGSTTNYTKRKQTHKEMVFNDNPRKVYVSIRENGGWKSWNMIKICDYPCKDRREAEQEEDKHMMELKAGLNTHRASRTIKQYYKDNKDKYKQYYEDNKEEIKKQRTIKCNCECGSSFRHSDKARHQKSIKHQKYLKSLN